MTSLFNLVITTHAMCNPQNHMSILLNCCLGSWDKHNATAGSAYVKGLVVTIQTDIAVPAIVGPRGLHGVAHLVCHVLWHRLRLQC